jgi:hypothetical protein
VFTDLLPDLLRGGHNVWTFGRGLASASENRNAIWSKLVDGLAHIPPDQRNVQVLRGFLAELWETGRDLAQQLLDAALSEPALIAFAPILHSAVQLDARGVERLKQALKSGLVPVWMYRNLALGRTMDHVGGGDLRNLLLMIAEKPDGFEVALHLLVMRFHSDRSAQLPNDPELVEAGRALLRQMRFGQDTQRSDHELAEIARACLVGPEAAPLAAEVAGRLRRAVAAYETYSLDNDDLLKALLAVQSMAVLDALFEGDEQEQQAGVDVFDHLLDDRGNPADEISCETLVTWCSQDRARRYAVAASFISFARRAEEGGPKVWSEHAKALLAAAPDPASVLAVFVERFRPMSWSGSLAAQIEANARLLDDLDEIETPAVKAMVSAAKVNLAAEVTKERERETAEDRARDERFE